MAQITKTFDLSILVKYPFSRPKLDITSRDILTKKPKLNRTIQKAEAETLASESEIKQAKVKNSVDDARELAEGYEQVEATATHLLNILSERSKKAGLDMPFDPNTQPELAEAVWSLFAGKPTVVTFEMYVKLLGYESDLGKEMAKNLGAVHIGA